jgi:ribosomal protein L25 (general stress protein Ctc)
MSKSEVLEISERDTTISPRKLRSVGFIPATIYGKGREPQSVQVKSHPLHMALKAGHREFTLKGVGADIQATVKQIQKVSTREEVLHVEFLSPVG